MKPLLLAALALPVLLTGCATDVAVGGGGYYGPGYYGPGYAYDDGFYGGSVVDVGIGGGYYGYDRGYYHHHYDGGSHSTALARSSSHVSHGSFAGVSRSSSHAGSSHASASISSGGGHSGGGGHGGGHR